MFWNLLLNLLAVLLGGLITWYFSWRYYKKAWQELKAEAARLSQLAKIALNAMEDAGMVELNCSDDFTIIGR